MSLARLISRGQSGLDAYEVSVEVHIAGGLPGFTITGLPAPAVRESRERVRAALQNGGFEVPPSRITVHLGPADIPKQGGRFDLAIALGIIQAREKRSWRLEDLELLGELSLAGEIRPVTGIVPAALAATAAGHRLVIPAGNAAEAGLVPGVAAASARSLGEVVAALDGKAALPRVVPTEVVRTRESTLSLDDVRGQAAAKRALTVAAAGGHNLLMIGPPGCGKSMLASRARILLPALGDDELLEVASIASVAGERSALENGRLRPFRAPHHTTRAPALVGGGAHPRPGEISLAHRGVLFLDELPEFSREALEAMREPLETGRVAISRLGHRFDFPAEFQLLAAMNPCPCGFLGDGTDRCRCAPFAVQRYRSRISGPLLDRFDLHVEMSPVRLQELAATRPGAGSPTTGAELRTLVERARLAQLARGALNARLRDRDVWNCVGLASAARRLLERAQDRWQLSARSVVRVLRVARTLADIDGAREAAGDHVAEALKLRMLDRPASCDTV